MYLLVGDTWLRRREPLGTFRATPPVCWEAAVCFWSLDRVQGSERSREPGWDTRGAVGMQASTPLLASPRPWFDHHRQFSLQVYQ